LKETSHCRQGLAEQYSRALGRTISGEDIPDDDVNAPAPAASGLSNLLAGSARSESELRM
jgi:hypothetical protein